MKKLCLYPFFCLFPALLFACSSDNPIDDEGEDDNNETKNTYIQIKIGESDISDLFFTGNSGTHVIEVKSDDDVTCTATGWCQIPEGRKSGIT